MRMQLKEAILTFQPSATDRSAIFALEPISPTANARVAQLAKDYSVPPELAAAGFRYVVGAEDLGSLLAWSAKNNLGSERVVDLVCHFALHDAYPEWANQLGVS